MCAINVRIIIFYARRLVHPHILPIHDFGEAEGYTYLVMPYIEGGTLRVPLAGPLDGIRFVRIETTKSPSWVSWHEIEVIAPK